MQRSMRSIALLALSLIVAACGADPEGTPAASPPATTAASPTAFASASASPSPASPAQTSSPASPAETPSPGIALDTVVRTTVNGLRLREEPGIDAISLGTLSEGAPSYVVNGPAAADGYSWYLLAGLGLPLYSGCAGPVMTDPWECPVWFGWAAAASPEGDPWLEDTELDCPAWPEVVTPEITFGVQRIAYLACFGDEERSLTGFYPPLPDDAGLGGACAGVPEELSWIACNLGYESLVPDEATAFGSGFVFSVDPESVTMPERGQWIRVTGRFDHPQAAHCTFGDPPSRSVLQCRAQFVVESSTVVPGP